MKFSIYATAYLTGATLIGLMNAATAMASPLNIEQPEAPVFISSETGFSAVIERNGLDFSSEHTGRVQEVGQLINVSYAAVTNCDNGQVLRNDWEVVFDLDSNTFSSRAKQVSNCMGPVRSPQWVNYDRAPSSFSIDVDGANVVVRGDSRERDGSILVQNSYIVRYSRQ